MRILFFLLCSFVVINSFALDLSTEWTKESKKVIHLSCQENEVLCEDLCEGKSSCQIQEKVCKNCVGTSIAMTYAFQEMGRAITSGLELDPYFIYDLLEEGRFVSLTSRSVYNLVESFDSIKLRRQFRSLCTDGTRYPMVFFGTTPAGELGRAQAIWCQSGIYEAQYLSDRSEKAELY